MFYSPLRYPGGKNRLAKFIAQICVDNNINGHYVEPYAGGASVALYLLIEGKVNNITINDYDRSIYAFWYSVLYNTEKLCHLIEKTEINIRNWKKVREIQNNKKKANLLELGFSTFFLNRTNHSGIIKAGVIGGIEQKGKYAMDCRFKKEALIRRINRIASFKNNIELYNLDALELIDTISSHSKNKKTIFYFDPPYYHKGSSLYMNYYDDEQHQKIAERIQKIKNSHWIISYDNNSEIKKLYKWVSEFYEYKLNHFSGKFKKGDEILFFSDNLVYNKSLLPI